MKESLSSELIEALRGYDTPTVSNAIEALNVRDRTEGYTSMEVRCQFPDLRPMVGYAVTCKMDSTSPRPRSPNRILYLLDVIQGSPKPSIVVIQDCGSDRARSCFVGDMMCAACQRLGAVGIVTDGGIRDLAGIRRRAPDFQIFTRGAVVSHGNVVVVEVGIPVSICGLDIRPGDLVHGDESGLLKVPLDIVPSVLEQARVVRNMETEFFEFLQGSSYTYDALKNRFLRH